MLSFIPKFLKGQTFRFTYLNNEATIKLRLETLLNENNHGWIQKPLIGKFIKENVFQIWLTSLTYWTSLSTQPKLKGIIKSTGKENTEIIINIKSRLSNLFAYFMFLISGTFLTVWGVLQGNITDVIIGLMFTVFVSSLYAWIGQYRNAKLKDRYVHHIHESLL